MSATNLNRKHQKNLRYQTPNQSFEQVWEIIPKNTLTRVKSICYNNLCLIQLIEERRMVAVKTKNYLNNNNDDEEVGSSYDYVEKSKRSLYIEKAQFSIFELARRFKQEAIILRPDYQRLDVWTTKKKSRLIESVLLNIPIPALYFAEHQDEKKEVVDGQQRLTAFFDFFENKYLLEKLEVLDELNGKTFKELSSSFQRKLQDYQLYIFIITKASHPDIRFDVFQRVNEGASQLTAQELRNALYHGDRIEFLKELSKNKNFKEMIGKGIQTKRLKDNETALRFLAFYINGYEKYNGNLNSFLNSTLDNLIKKDYDRLKNIFITTMETIFEVWGEDAFIKGDAQKKKTNLSLFDILSYSFAQYPPETILNAKKSIKKALNELIDKKGDFYDAISTNTLTKSSVKTRFDLWLGVMEKSIKKN